MLEQILSYCELLQSKIDQRKDEARAVQPPKRLKTDLEMARAWRRMFPDDFPEDRAGIIILTEPQTAIVHRGQSQVAGCASNVGTDVLTGATRWGSSLNWSGAILAARDGKAFRAVATRFVVPHPAVPEGAPPPQALTGRANAYSASIWVGLDGHRTATPSLPQAGIAVGRVFDKALGQERDEVYAWAQWWTSGNLDGEARFKDFVVRPDDLVTVWVSLEADGAAYFRIRNETRDTDAISCWSPAAAPAPGDAPDPLQDDGPHMLAISARPAVHGSAASFVVERPMALVPPEEFAKTDQRDLLYPMPAFGSATFQDCCAVMGSPGFEDSSCLRDLSGRRLIRMFRQVPEPWRTMVQSTPRGPALDRLEVAFQA